MAGAILRDLLAGREAEFVVETAGLGAEPGLGAESDAVAVLREQGLDLSGHRTRRLEAQMVAEADLILTMTRSHKQQVLRLHPRAAEKTFTLLEFAYDDRESDVEDPFGRGHDTYRRTAQELRRALTSVVDKLLSDPLAD